MKQLRDEKESASVCEATFAAAAAKANPTGRITKADTKLLIHFEVKIG